LNRNAGNWLRSDVYFERSVGVCRELFGKEFDKKRRRAIRKAKARAFMGWGTLWRDLGNYGRALRLYSRAAACARRGGVKWLAAEVSHDMLVLASEMENFQSAAYYASQALQVYPVHNHRVPALGYDLALLLVRQHMHEPALELVREAVSRIASPREQLIVKALVARAAAGAGRLEEFEEVTAQVLDTVRNGWEERAVGALVHLTFAARSLGDWERANLWATYAARLLAERNIGGEERELVVYLQQEIAARRKEAPVRQLDTAESSPLLTSLYSRLLDVLRAWRGPTWRRKDQAGPDARGKT
jgi:tetratricopeptide (TPR) repeat protein